MPRIRLFTQFDEGAFWAVSVKTLRININRQAQSIGQSKLPYPFGKRRLDVHRLVRFDQELEAELEQVEQEAEDVMS